MYVPNSFAEHDPAALEAFVREHSFATVVTTHAGSPFASHLPLLFDPHAGTPGRLLGHVARANPQALTADGDTALAIFHGPHTYISPGWYQAARVVPTWNYVAVHATGRWRPIADRDRLREIVQRLVTVYEAPQPQPWMWTADDAGFVDSLLDAIVGFEIEVERWEGKWKLSQNQPRERRERVIAALRPSSDPDARKIAALIEQRLDS